jgi:cobalt-zinc-cadmium resistance protein CzcA
VRSVGQIRSMDEIRTTMLSARDGAPVLVSDVATVTVGNEPRLGIAGQNDTDDIVQGIVLMRRGAETLPTLTAVLAEVERINTSDVLPPGVHIERIYDRSALVDITTHTVLHNMLMGVTLIFLIQWLFLGDLRSALIVAATIPFALLFAVVILVLNGESANLLSMGAIDFGIIVDATVIMVENIFRHLAEASRGGPVRDKTGTIFTASREVTQAIFFSATIIIAGFLPLFTLSGVEGHIFGPMARTYAYALAGGLLATFTVTPALSALILPNTVGHAETRVVRALSRFYGHVRDGCSRAVAPRWPSARGRAGGDPGRQLDRARIPAQARGRQHLDPRRHAGVDLARSRQRLRQPYAPPDQGLPSGRDRDLQHGRPDDGTDSTGFFNAEFFVPLKPFDRWRKGVDKEQLIAEISDALEKAFPGVEFTFSQYIQDNVQEAASGVKSENSVKVFGNDLETLAKVADDIKNAIATVPGVTDLAVSASLGQPTIRIDIDRGQGGALWLGAGRHQRHRAGLRSAARRRRRLRERQRPPLPDGRAPGAALSRESRSHQADPDRRADREGRDPGAVVRSGECRLVSGAFYIYREQQARYVPVKFSVRGRDLGSAVLEAQQRVAEKVRIPGGYRVEWVGEFGNLKSALQRLAVAVPIAIALILLLLYVSFGSLRDTLLAGSAIPMALTGGVLALFMAGMPFSISAAIGFVALFGIAAMNGIMVLSCYNRLIESGVEREAALRSTCALQMRPVLMTCVSRLRRPAPRRLLDRDRQPGAKAAGDRRGWRHADRAAAVPHRAAGCDRPVLAPPAAGRSGAGRRAGAVLMRRVVGMIACSAALAGCTLGPDFVRPDAPKPEAYLPDTATNLVAGGIDGGEAQRIVQGLDIPGSGGAYSSRQSSTA